MAAQTAAILLGDFLIAEPLIIRLCSWYVLISRTIALLSCHDAQQMFTFSKFANKPSV